MAETEDQHCWLSGQISLLSLSLRGRQGLKISTGSLLSGPNVEQAAPAPHLADLHIRAGSLLPTADIEQAAKYQNFPRCPEY